MTNPLGLTPYAQQFVIEGVRGPRGVPYTATVTGLNLPDVVREATEEMAREYFRRTNPGVAIEREQWIELYETGDDE